MSPSVDCVASLYCAEDVSAATWGDEDSGKCAYLESVSELQPTVFLDFSVEDDDAVSTLLLKEAQYMPEPDYSERYHSRELSNGARLDAVRWIQKVTNFTKTCSLYYQPVLEVPISCGLGNLLVSARDNSRGLFVTVIK